MRKVLIVWRGYGWGGTQVRLLDWLSRVDYSKNEILVLCPTDEIARRVQEREIPARCLNLPNDETIRLFGHYDMKIGRDELAEAGFWSPFLNWSRLLFKIRPNSIVLMGGHLFSYPPPCMLAAFLASRGHVYHTVHSMGKLEELPKKKSTKHFGFVPGIGLWWYKSVWLKTWPARLQARLASKTLVAGTAIRNMIVGFYGYPAEKVGVIHHGVDAERFRPSQRQRDRQKVRRALDVPEDTLVILSTARLSKEKGVDRLLRAFDALGDDRGKAWLLLAGDGPLRPEIEDLASRSTPAHRIKVLGHVEDVCPLLQASDIFILPSDNEGFGTALVEAMATARVCVATRGAGPCEIITDGEDGYLVEISDEGVLFGLKKALNLSAAERELLGQRARRKVLVKFDVQSAVSRALAYLGVAENKKSAGLGGGHVSSAPADRPVVSDGEVAMHVSEGHYG